jgi:hypothetical protein
MAGEVAKRGWMARVSSSMYTLFALAVACALLLAAAPRAIAPTELPGLELPANEVADVLARDAARAQVQPGERSRELLRLFHEFGQSENAALENAQLVQQRRRALRHVYDRVVEAEGAAAALAVRERALAKFEDLLALQPSPTTAAAVLGVFPSVLAQHGATFDGEEVAPHFVLRTLYKARWNLMTRLPVDFEFARVEKLAYYGWLGLRADNLPLSERRKALQQYAAAGGAHAAEAQGVLAFLDQDYPNAIRELERAHAEHPSLRLRNYLQGAHVAVSLQGQEGVAARDR